MYNHWQVTLQAVESFSRGHINFIGEPIYNIHLCKLLSVSYQVSAKFDKMRTF